MTPSCIGLGVLRDRGDQDQRTPAPVQAIGHNRTEGIAGDIDRQGGEHTVAAGRQQPARLGSMAAGGAHDANPFSG